MLLFSLVALPSSVSAQSGDAQPGAEQTASAPDVSTPRRALASFLADAHEQRWQDAARSLDLRELSPERQSEVAVATARDLALVLDARAVHPNALPDESSPRGQTAVEVTRVPGVTEPVTLRRVRHQGAISWLFSPNTVRNASALAAHVDRGPLGNAAPRVLVDHQLAGLEAWQWIGLATALALAALAALGLGKAVTAIACRMVKDTERTKAVRAALESAQGPMRAALFLAILGLLATLLHLPVAVMPVAGRLYTVCWMVTGGWLFLRIVDFGAREVAERAATKDGWRARGTRTRVMILRQVLRVTGIVVLCAVLLMQIDSVRQLGVSLLASAGVAGIVVGLAAQRTIGNLLAGIQLSFTQPLRVGDKVVIEGQFGTVEEINLSYVVVQIWDERRLIVPMAKLLESAFENWTRVSSHLIGEVKVPVDFGAPVDRIRDEVTNFVKAHPLFDGRTVAVQVTGAQERTAELRVLVSAADASKVFDLRCATREHLLTILRGMDAGQYLPRVRVNPSAAPVGDAGAVQT